MASGRRQLSPFSLSFLDIMFCGFGAVVLLVLVINSGTVRGRKAGQAGLAAQVEARRVERDAAAAFAGELEEQQRAAAREIAAVETELNQLEEQMRRQTDIQEKAAAETRERRVQLEEHENQLRAMTRNRAVLASAVQERGTGKQVLTHPGEGRRQYLTGLRLGGKRILLLVDMSASMLDQTIVNVIRRRNMDDARKQEAPKWRQVEQTVRWLVANMPSDAGMQLIVFGRGIRNLGSGPGWIAAEDGEGLDRLLEAFGQVVPEGGTSLDLAFQAAADLKPRPDNIVLLTDGLPTMAGGKSGGGTVSGDARLRLFDRAVRLLPAAVPVNTILYPLEGDPLAAVRYWQLAVDTGGSFFTPTRDWP